MTLLLIPFRLAASTAALWVGWVVYDRDVNHADYTDVAAPVAFALVNGLLVGVHLVLCVMLAVFAWYPLPRRTLSRGTLYL